MAGILPGKGEVFKSEYFSQKTEKKNEIPLKKDTNDIYFIRKKLTIWFCQEKKTLSSVFT